LENAPRQKSTFLTIWRKPWAKKFQHIFGCKLFDIFDRLSVKKLDEHRGRRLADATSFPIEVNFPNLAPVDDS